MSYSPEKANVAKNRVQAEAKSKLLEGIGGLITMCTGSGKSKVAMDKAVERDKTTLLVVPTINLRDINWYKEFEKWGHLDFYNSKLKRVCYASLANQDMSGIETIILDEAHRLTDNTKHKIKGIYTIALTATCNEEKKKVIGLPHVFHYPLEQAVKDGVIPEYRIKIAYAELSSKKDIKVEYKKNGQKKHFYTSEKDNMEYVEKEYKKKTTALRIALNSYYDKCKAYGIYHYGFKLMDNPNVVKNKIAKSRKELRGDDLVKHNIALQGLEEAYKKYAWKILNLIRKRRQLIYESKSKEAIGAKILKSLKDKKTIVFCSSTSQADRLGVSYHSNRTKKENDKALSDFHNDKISKLYCVDKLNEGENIAGIQAGVAYQVNSTELAITQRTGRVLRADYLPIMYIICLRNTQDEVWLNKALLNFDRNFITEHRFIPRSKLKTYMMNGRKQSRIRNRSLRT